MENTWESAFSRVRGGGQRTMKQKKSGRPDSGAEITGKREGRGGRGGNKREGQGGGVLTWGRPGRAGPGPEKAGRAGRERGWMERAAGRRRVCKGDGRAGKSGADGRQVREERRRPNPGKGREGREKRRREGAIRPGNSALAAAGIPKTQRKGTSQAARGR